MTTRTIELTVYVDNAVVGDGSIVDEYQDNTHGNIVSRQVDIYLDDTLIGNGTYEDKITYNGGGIETKQVSININGYQIGYMQFDDKYGRIVSTRTKKSNWLIPIIIISGGALVIYLMSKEQK